MFCPECDDHLRRTARVSGYDETVKGAISMAIQFCPECGAKLLEGARFCSKCRCEITQEPQTQTQQVEMSGYCSECGAPLIKGAAFCSKCRSPVTENVTTPTVQEQTPIGSATGEVRKVSEVVQNTRSLMGSVSASVTPGNMSVAIPDMSGAGALTDGTILAPIQTVLRSIGGFVGSIKSTLANKRALMTALVTSAVWIALWLWNRSGHSNKLSEILSGLTFAEGGTRGNVGQIIGGAFGKGMVISMFMSLFGGEARSLVSGAKRLFGKGSAPGFAIIGLGAAVLCYQLFAGYAGTYGIMVAVSGAVLSLQALGGSSGFFGRLAKSVVSKKLNGVRTADETRVKSLLTGTAAGFAVSACLSALSVPWWIGLIIMAAGIALDVVLGRNGVES